MPRKAPRQRGRAGEGTVFQRRDGKWIASISVGGRASRRQIRRICETESIANEALRKLRATHRHIMESGAGEPPDRVDVYIDRWLEAQKPRIRSTTYSNYETILRVHVKPILGAMRADRVRPSDIAAMMTTLERNGAAPRVRELAYLRIRSVLGALVPEILPANPVKPIHRARVERKTMSVWTQEQARAFLEATANDREANLYRLALSVGMRRGEILALRWRDVDLKNRRLSVQHTLTAEGELVNAKTSGSRRTIELPARTAAALVAQREKLLAEGLRTSAYVFPDEKGEPYSGRRLLHHFNLAVKTINNARLAADEDAELLPAIRFHDLRHTAATIALSIGLHPKIVSEMLGHASIQITLDTYSHSLPSMQKDAAEKLDAVL